MSSDPRPAEPPFARIAIVGLGVMGGSLARALARTWPTLSVAGWAPDPGERRAALAEGVLAAAPASPEEAVREASLVVLAVPLGAALDLLEPLAHAAPAHATLSDVVSLKRPMADAARRAGVSDRWVGSHPMAGSEGSGFGASVSGLYLGARVWLSAEPEAGERAAAVAALWSGLGGCPVEIAADDHDELMALVSHLPQLLSNLLAAELSRRSVDTDALGPGARDMTRLAGSAPSIWRDLLAHAPSTLPGALRAIGAGATELAGALEAGDLRHVEALMRATRAWRAGP